MSVRTRQGWCSAGSSISLSAVILVRVHVETNYPGPSRETAESIGVVRNARQSLFELAGDAGEIGENAVGKLFFAELRSSSQTCSWGFNSGA